MSLIEPGGIDCDIHPSVPSLKALHPYLSDHWRDIIIQRGTNHGWANRSNSNCRIAFVLIDGRYQLDTP